MEARRLRVPEEVARRVRGLHPDIKRKVRRALQTVLDDPCAGKPLKEELAGLRSYRLGRLRIVYRLANDGNVDIVSVGPRRNIYEETYRRIRKQKEG
ncbi:MAG: type II toxin-antitoxin system RelE/ParE family toxin [Gammaproteobacteria bacterium]|nr:type II toxin-antitoxin system RelE/ParE family toxin [Gammaproteobacteria bacterium]